MKEMINKCYKTIEKKSIIKPIVCLSTSNKHNSAIGIIRISLGNYKNIYKKIVKNLTKKNFFFPRLATCVNIFVKKKKIDKGILIYFPAPNSYNGETILEIHLHDNKYLINKIIKYIINNFSKYGMRMAKKGELTKRAFINNKINMIDVLNIYNTIKKKKKNKDLLYYKLRSSFKKISNDIYDIIINIENKINFNFELKNFDFNIKNKFEKLIDNIKIKKKNFFFYLNNKNKINVTIIGKTNSGKSSLFNKILNYERSIVSKKKGTTTNYISEEFKYKGYKFIINDTVGYRLKMKKNEKKGFKISENILKYSDIFIDLSSNVYKKNTILVKNKIDKNKKKYFSKKVFKISCKTNFGIKELINEIFKKVKKNKKKNNNFLIIINKLLYKIIKINKDFLNKKMFYEELSEKMIKIHDYLISFFSYNEKKITNEIFKKFCIGK
ncbi:GTPase [Candidatus Vidania fulgoroideorum]